MWKVYRQTTDRRQTDKRTTDKKRSEKLTWTFSSGELTNMFKKQRKNVINRKFNTLLMNMEFISLVRNDFYHIFVKILKILSYLWNKFHIHQETLNILYLSSSYCMAIYPITLFLWVCLHVLSYDLSFLRVCLHGPSHDFVYEFIYTDLEKKSLTSQRHPLCLCHMTLFLWLRLHVPSHDLVSMTLFTRTVPWPCLHDLVIHRPGEEAWYSTAPSTPSTPFFSGTTVWHTDISVRNSRMTGAVTCGRQQISLYLTSYTSPPV
jgi:hypothetical protein